MKTYEYAGFIYEMNQDDNGRWIARPLDGQHPAASKNKHRRAAVECWVAGLAKKGGK